MTEPEMTEAEWLTATDLTPMLELVRRADKLTGRKWRLFAVACCHRIRLLLTDERSRQSVAVAERYADGMASYAELDAAFEEGFDAGAELAEEMEGNPEAFTAAGRNPLLSAAWAASEASHPDESADDAAAGAADAVGSTAEHEAQSELLRCLFGNPFHPVTADPSWLTSTTVALARRMYDARDFSLMPVLADALQDAGCDHPDVLTHCRGPGPHVRGCWVVDLVLGKE